MYKASFGGEVCSIPVPVRQAQHLLAPCDICVRALQVYDLHKYLQHMSQVEQMLMDDYPHGAPVSVSGGVGVLQYLLAGGGWRGCMKSSA